jgi:hypothetical protein
MGQMLGIHSKARKHPGQQPQDTTWKLPDDAHALWDAPNRAWTPTSRLVWAVHFDPWNFACEEGRAELVQWLLRTGTRCCNPTHAWNVAALNGHLHVVKLLPQHGYGFEYESGTQPMHAAIRGGQLKVLVYLHLRFAPPALRRCQLLINAAVGGHLQVVLWLVRNWAAFCTDSLPRACWLARRAAVRWDHGDVVRAFPKCLDLLHPPSNEYLEAHSQCCLQGCCVRQVPGPPARRGYPECLDAAALYGHAITTSSCHAYLEAHSLCCKQGRCVRRQLVRGAFGEVDWTALQRAFFRSYAEESDPSWDVSKYARPYLVARRIIARAMAQAYVNPEYTWCRQRLRRQHGDFGQQLRQHGDLWHNRMGTGVGKRKRDDDGLGEALDSCAAF